MKLPVNPLEIMNEGRKYLAEKEANINVALLIDPLAGDEYIEGITKVLTPQLSSAHLRVDVLGAGDQIHRTRFKRYAFVALLVSARQARNELDDYIRERVLAIKEAGVPIALLVSEGAAADVAARYGVSVLDVVIVPHAADIEQKLGAWVLDHLKDQKIALSANYPFMREEIARSYVKATSIQNAVIGGILFIPGADMPVMTLNQIKMIMQIAVIYEQKLDKERVKELAVVLASAFLFRTIARQLAGMIPGFGWAFKAGIAYSVTYAMGLTAQNYFREGGDIAGIGTYLKEKTSDITVQSKELMQDRKTQKIIKDAQKAEMKKVRAEARAEAVKKTGEQKVVKEQNRSIRIPKLTGPTLKERHHNYVSTQTPADESIANETHAE